MVMWHNILMSSGLRIDSILIFLGLSPPKCIKIESWA